MSFRTTLQVSCYDERYVLVVEPWAEQFEILPEEECLVVALNDSVVPSFGVEHRRYGLMVWVSEAGSTYEFRRGDVCEFTQPVAIPF